MHSVHLKWQLLIALLLPLVGLFGCSEDSPEGDFKIVLRLSHVFSPKEELAIALESVAERVLEKTDGAVKILTYPQGQIAAYKDGVEMVVRGAYFISVEDPSYIGDYMPEFTALVGPMLYRNFEEYTGLVETPLVRGWVKELEEKGIKVLSLKYIFGFRNLITDREIRRPEDLAGLKLRTPGSKLFIETINAMGATATPLPWGETFSAIQQGVVDGLEGSDRYQRIIEQEITEEADRMIERLNVKHRDVVKALEAQGVQFNEIDRPAFEQRTVGVFETMPGVTMAMYHRIQDELSRIRQDQQQGAAND
jgi:TRAP-type C4-dicarboxylate transport system substrate-binding protein